MPPPLQYEKTAAFEDSPTGGVTSIAFSPTGVHLASAGLDCRVCIWRVRDGSLSHSFSASSPVLSLAWVPSRNDGMLVCGCQDGSIITLTTPTPQMLQGSNFPRTHSFPVEHLAVVGKRLVSGAHTELAVWELSSADRWVHIVDLDIPPKNSYNEELEVLVTSLHWTSSKSRRPLLIATYMHHGYVVYDAGNWSRVLAIPMNSLIANASVTSDGRKLAVSNMVSGFDIYDTNTGSSLGTLSHIVDKMYAVPVLFAHGGNAVIGGSTVGEVDVWDATNFRKHQTLVHGDEDLVLSLAAHYDSRCDQFLIATAIVNDDATTAITLWCAEGSGLRGFWTWLTLWSSNTDLSANVLSLLVGLLGATLVLVIAMTIADRV